MDLILNDRNVKITLVWIDMENRSGNLINVCRQSCSSRPIRSLARSRSISSIGPTTDMMGLQTMIEIIAKAIMR